LMGGVLAAAGLVVSAAGADTPDAQS